MYLSQIAVRHQKASSAGMFISRRAAIGAWITFGYWNVMIMMPLIMLVPMPCDNIYYLCLAISFYRIEDTVSFQNSEQLFLGGKLCRLGFLARTFLVFKSYLPNSFVGAPK